MAADAAVARVAYAEYQATERRSGIKHEYLDGLVRAMAGGTIEHGRLSMRFSRLLGDALAHRSCEVFSSDVKVRIEASNRTVYPDLSFVCGRLERSDVDADAIVNPTVIVEVLSETSEAYDRGDKFRHYRRIQTLREYVLVSQTEPLVEVWRREGDAWRPREYGAGDEVRLESLDATLRVDELYENALSPQP
jgi:Uma2 family endonuclease